MERTLISYFYFFLQGTRLFGGVFRLTGNGGISLEGSKLQKDLFLQKLFGIWASDSVNNFFVCTVVEKISKLR